MAKNQVSEKQQKNNKKANVFVRFGRWISKKFKEMISELKKVSWPKFGKVLKQTGIVISVVLIFLVLLTAMDFGLLKLRELITRL